ncbi:DUF2268 domain-containing protein [Cytobacillus sp. FJAT-54145]|uniref:DUF2268 domain-containing protein n=1 Tax=Cytobacillus spartinae TaxID=3299023 RepID=A0ABW6KBR8_9BACI
MKEFDDDHPSMIYDYLVSFGMYRPSPRSWGTFQEMKNEKIWEKVSALFEKYSKKWNGPDIPIYIFPINERMSLQENEGNNKSGVSFKDKMFLFVKAYEDEKELEALFVHEYHHVCRMNKQKKQLKDYTLLDSMILEGLAEITVEKYCGKDYQAPWCNYYTNKEIKNFWNKFLEKEINVIKEEDKHDRLLYGFEPYPKLVGYAAGYHLVRKLIDSKNFSTKVSFALPSEIFVGKNKNF